MSRNAGYIIVGLTASVLLKTLAAAQQEEGTPEQSPIEVAQIEMPAVSASVRKGQAYLDTAGHPNVPQNLPIVLQDENFPSFRRDYDALARQISAPGEGAPGIAQLSKTDLAASLAQLTAAERRVLFQAIDGSDICNNPPNLTAIAELCRKRLETRAGDFTPAPERSLSAEDRLMSGNLESTTLPSIAEVIERLARAGASSGDPNNQEIAAMALGPANPASSRPDEEAQGQSGVGLGDEAQALINSLINQLGGAGL